MADITVTIPDAVFEQDAQTIAREVLERAALEAYRNSVISVGRLANILGLSIDEAHGFLKKNDTPANITFDDVERGFEVISSDIRGSF